MRLLVLQVHVRRAADGPPVGAIGAAVALKPGAHAEVGELKSFVRDRLAAYKYPREIWFVDSVPKGPTGKILRREVQAPDATVIG